MSAAPPRERSSPLQTLASGRGTCRDFATLMMEAARALGFAARFVSGYLYVPDRDIGERHLGGGSTHAWCQIYLPGAGWVEFDPTNGIVGSRDLIRVAVAREAHQAIPLHGSYFGDAADDEGMDVSVNVRRLPERTLLAPDDGNLCAMERHFRRGASAGRGSKRRQATQARGSVDAHPGGL